MCRVCVGTLIAMPYTGSQSLQNTGLQVDTTRNTNAHVPDENPDVTLKTHAHAHGAGFLGHSHVGVLTHNGSPVKGEFLFRGL